MNDSTGQATARVRRARLWLGTAVVVHVITLVAINGLAGLGYVRPAPMAGVVSVLAAGPLLVLLWYERRDPSDDRPACWPARAVATSLPQAAASGMVGSHLIGETVLAGWPLSAVLACATLSVQVGPAVLASRTLRCPLTPELGETDVEVLARVRSSRGVPRWLEYDDVRVTDQHVIATIRPNMSWKGVLCIPLVDVVSVDVRPGTPQDSPWIRLEGEFAYDVPAGDVVVIHHRCGTQVLPVYDAAAVADLIRVRAGKVQGSTKACSVQDSEK